MGRVNWGVEAKTFGAADEAVIGVMGAVTLGVGNGDETRDGPAAWTRYPPLDQRREDGERGLIERGTEGGYQG